MTAVTTEPTPAVCCLHGGWAEDTALMRAEDQASSFGVAHRGCLPCVLPLAEHPHASDRLRDEIRALVARDDARRTP